MFGLWAAMFSHVWIDFVENRLSQTLVLILNFNFDASDERLPGMIISPPRGSQSICLIIFVHIQFSALFFPQAILSYSRFNSSPLEVKTFGHESRR